MPLSILEYLDTFLIRIFQMDLNEAFFKWKIFLWNKRGHDYGLVCLVKNLNGMDLGAWNNKASIAGH